MGRTAAGIRSGDRRIPMRGPGRISGDMNLGAALSVFGVCIWRGLSARNGARSRRLEQAQIPMLNEGVGTRIWPAYFASQGPRGPGAPSMFDIARQSRGQEDERRRLQRE